MKFKKINNKKIICILISGFIIVSISGCSKTDSSLNNTYKQNNEIITETNNTDENTKEINNIDEIQNTSNNNLQNKITYSDNDEIAIETFNNLNYEIDSLLNSEKIEDVKETAKGTFVTIVDFIFYDSEINGVTFDELTDSGKQKVLEIANKIDTKIENKFPNYKETISDKTKKAFNKASELIKKGANNLNDFSKEKLGEDNYNAIIDAKDEFIDYTKQAIEIIGDVGSNAFESGKEYIKNWYENLKRD